MSKEKVIAVFSVAGFVLAFVATVYELYEFIGLGPVVRRPISANSGVNFNPGFFIPLWSRLFEIISLFFFRASDNQILQKKKYAEFFVLAFRFHIYPGLTQL